MKDLWLKSDFTEGFEDDKEYLVVL